MSDGSDLREATAQELRFGVTAADFPFEDTRSVQPLAGIVGQPRALEALELGVGIRHADYHIYASGMTGTGRLELIAQALAERVGQQAVPDDWIYVNNFRESDRPLAFALPAGDGAHFRRAMRGLIETLAEALPRAFREEDFGREKDRLREQYRTRGQEVFHELEEQAKANEMGVAQLPDGQILFVPLRDGKPLPPDELPQLPPERIAELEQRQEGLVELAAKVLERQHEIERQLAHDVREVARGFAARIVGPLVDRIAERFPQPRIVAWLEDLRRHLVDHLDRFRPSERMPPERIAALTEGHELHQHGRFVDYQVNLVVDNAGLQGPPIVVEQAPTYRNLFGTIERIVDRFGRVTANFTRIKAGSLLKANGGYLAFDLGEALTEPLVWKELKRTLKRGAVEIDVWDPFAMFTVSGLKPDPIPLTVKLVAVGSPLVYHLLCLYDEDFLQVFRVKAEFESDLPLSEGGPTFYAQFVRRMSDTEGTRPFTAAGVAELCRRGARLADHGGKVTTEFTHVADIVRESDFEAARGGSPLVDALHVRRAEEQRVRRSDLVERRMRELIEEGTILLEFRERCTGQVNGLVVADLGDYAFGRPARVTASTGVGTAGVINIERESRLSGRSFDKALLVLEGWLRGAYGRDQALSLSASIALEQSYGGVDGDSASVAELLALLGSLADVPLRQDLAVTGSINQRGEVQAIGGANEKVEGFYDACRALGALGSAGVCLPRANLRHLVLRPDVVEAVGRGEFHVWPVDHVDQALELFSGLPAGDVSQPESFHGRVARRLAEMADALRRQAGPGAGRVSVLSGGPVEPPTDPRPPLPGDE